MNVLELVARRAARRYVPGDSLTAALAVHRTLTAVGVTTTVGYWNADDESPAAVEAETLRLVRAIGAGGEVSVKVPALRPGALTRVAGVGARVHCDALAPGAQEEVLAQAIDAGAGVTLPGRWRRSLGDAAAIASSPLPVRVVKGQWTDPGDPARDPRQGFAEVIDALAGRRAPVEVATHDGPLAAWALARLSESGTPCELQLLYGLPAQSPLARRPAGMPVRVYVPYGTAFLPYALRAAVRRPRVAIRLAGDLMRDPGPWEGQFVTPAVTP